MTCQKMNRRELLNYINEISFAVDDTKLFLDTHPWDQNALLFFNECSEKRNEALREYASAYGPLTIDTATACESDYWSWINEPCMAGRRLLNMWNYEKRLQYPVRITQTNPRLAQVIISQFGGPDGELGASMRYLSQRYTMPYKEVTGILTDIGTEELAHLEIVCAIVHQLTRNLSPEEIEHSGFAPYYVDHTLALWPQSAGGVPWSATTFQSKGDPITDLHEDLSAEQKARTTYDNILRLIKDPEVCDPIRFLREREIVHYQRFGESLRIVQEKLDSKNFYAVNPEFDR